jgi:hypothetical protein
LLLLLAVTCVDMVVLVFMLLLVVTVRISPTGYQPRVVEEADAWAAAFRKASATIKLVATRAKLWDLGVNLRENVASDFDALGRTTVQRMHEVLNKKDALDDGKNNTTAIALSEYYEENVNLAEKSEKVTHTFINQTFTIATRAWIFEDVRDAFAEAEEDRHAGIFNAISRLQAMVDKALWW